VAENRAVLERWMRAMVAKDFDTMVSLMSDDYVEEMPQSGERVRGKATWLAMMRAYPGGVGTAESRRIVGAEDRWVMSPAFSLVRIEGSGDVYTLVSRVVYPKGDVWEMVAIAEFRGGKVAKTTAWYASPFEAPAWRAPFVERFEPLQAADTSEARRS
jgi:ketosteroid isomerase-like protein